MNYAERNTETGTLSVLLGTVSVHATLQHTSFVPNKNVVIHYKKELFRVTQKDIPFPS